MWTLYRARIPLLSMKSFDKYPQNVPREVSSSPECGCVLLSYSNKTGKLYALIQVPHFCGFVSLYLTLPISDVHENGCQMDSEFKRLKALAEEKESDLHRLKAAYEDDMQVVKESMLSSDQEIAQLRKKLHEANDRVERWKKRLGARRKSVLQMRSITTYDGEGKSGEEEEDGTEEEKEEKEE